MRLSDEEGLVRRGFIIVVLLVAVLGLAAVDGGSILFAKLKLDDAANAGAVAGAQQLRVTHSVEAARQAALQAVADSDGDASVTGFAVDPQGEVSVTVRTEVPTILARRIGFLKRFRIVRSSATEGPPSL